MLGSDSHFVLDCVETNGALQQQRTGHIQQPGVAVHRHVAHVVELAALLALVPNVAKPGAVDGREDADAVVETVACEREMKTRWQKEKNSVSASISQREVRQRK